VDKEIGESGVGYAKLKRMGFKDAAAAASDHPVIFWGLQSVKDDIKDKTSELAKLMDSKHYSDSELCLFKLIIEDLCTVTGKGRNGSLDHNYAINRCANAKPKALKVDEAMSCIDRLVDEGWLEMQNAPNSRGARHSSKLVTLGRRSMIDLQRFITDTWSTEELCCVWDNDWLFKWITSAAGADSGVSGDNGEPAPAASNDGRLGEDPGSADGGEDEEDAEQGGEKKRSRGAASAKVQGKKFRRS
jgi:hypothetical protein